VSAEGILARTWHADTFRDKAALVELKRRQGLRISLAFPTLNEEATVGKEILVLRTELVDRFPLLDEIAVIDSGSTDATASVAARHGATVFSSRSILKRYGSYRGKGENLWKSLYVLGGDIIVWIDADISDIGPRFVCGLVGPLLADPSISYVKAFYERPLQSGTGLVPTGGGRVTEILVRPLFSLFYPELAGLVQPLAGEYAGRRSLLEQLPFSVGYGVELGHLIDICRGPGAGAIAQVNMERRVHRNQSLPGLGRMSFGILQTFLRRLEKHGQASFATAWGGEHLSVAAAGGTREIARAEVPAVERPPMITIPEYRKKFGREG
jgi:glucosyl-3-phosphoglycerate synthase